MEILLNFAIAIIFLLFLLGWIIGKLLPKDAVKDVLILLAHDAVLGIWHLIFGPPKRRIVRDKRRRRR